MPAPLVLLSFVLAAAFLLVAGSAAKHASFRFLRDHFADTGRNSDGRRRRRDFERCVWLAFSCLYFAGVLQALRGLSLFHSASVGVWLTVGQVGLGLAALVLGKAAWNRLKEPFAY